LHGGGIVVRDRKHLRGAFPAMRRFYRKNGIDGWILKGDISKYFYSIRHDVLKALIREKITDPDVLWLVDLIIDSTEGNVGIPIGNQT
jgi:retron-type reverse transcriptase